MQDETPPTYEVEELSIEEAVVLLATEREKHEAIFTQTSERLLRLCA